MPVFNSASTVSKSIKSILNQTFTNYQFLIIDDGSTDNSESIIKQFSDERIVYTKITHRGLGPCLNYGLEISEYEWIARIDADDLSHPQRLEKQIQFMNEHPEIDILSTWYSIFENNRIQFPVRTRINDFEIKKRLFLNSELAHSGIIYSRSKILELGGYRDTIFEDYELWVRIRKQVVFHNYPEILNFVLYNQNSLSRGKISSKNVIIYQLTSNMYSDQIFQEFGIKSISEQHILKGWREYFYGTKRNARLYWKNNMVNDFDLRLIIAFILTFIPDNVLILFKEFRLKFRIIYWLNYWSNENVKMRKIFSELHV